MGHRLKFFLFLLAVYATLLGLFAAVWFVFWSNLDEPEQALATQLLGGRVTLLVVLAVLLMGALGILLEALFQRFVAAPRQLVEATRLIVTANPEHRLTPQGSSALRMLAVIINELADQHQALKQDVARKIREANAGVEEEKNRLAALMSELAQSVLVCNIEGRILLYNNRAKWLLTQPLGGQASIGTPSLVGLGRSVFAIFDRNLITHALENIRDRLRQGNVSPVASFVTTAPSGQLIRAQMAPVVSIFATSEEPPETAPVSGFVLILEDITKSIEAGNRRDVLLQTLTEGTRASLANIRAAVETMLAYPEMEPERQHKFANIIGDEASALSGKLEHTVAEFADSLKTQWPLEEVRGADLIAAAQRRIETKLGMRSKTEAVDESLWLKADSYALMQAVTYLTSRLQEEFNIREVRFGLARAGRLAHLDLIWVGALIGFETLVTWQTQPLNMGGETSPLTLKDVLDRHDGEIWYQPEKAAQRAYFRLLIPAAHPEQSAWNMPTAVESRPEYYDFDLFNQPGQTPELDQRLLSELSYTVFDTETTGLNPSDGDEIISVGAVRIVNGRLLKHEVFEQLIDPKRPVSPEAFKVHGIEPALLDGQPAIGAVLPAFYQFCEDTVLVAHNAAFDMRFLQLKEGQTGVKFTQPVLDTLLLSAVVHPNQAGHHLEAIAQRLGVNVIGRHTSLGDAMVTGEIFLKLIPLLEQAGIRTLKQAREASQKTLYAKLEY